MVSSVSYLIIGWSAVFLYFSYDPKVWSTIRAMVNEQGNLFQYYSRKMLVPAALLLLLCNSGMSGRRYSMLHFLFLIVFLYSSCVLSSYRNPQNQWQFITSNIWIITILSYPIVHLVLTRRPSLVHNPLQPAGLIGHWVAKIYIRERKSYLPVLLFTFDSDIWLNSEVSLYAFLFI